MLRRFPWLRPLTPGHRVHFLVAGHGAGLDAMRTAARYKDAHVLVVDPNRASLAHAARQSRVQGIANIEFLCGDPMRILELQREFDVIESIGPPQPPAGITATVKALTQVLRPSGFIKLAIESRRGHAHLLPFRRAVHAACPDGTADQLRRARQLIRRDPTAHLAGVLDAKEFYSLGGFHDYLCDIRGDQFAPAELITMLGANGLSFLGFRRMSDNFRRSYHERFPHDPRISSLEHLDRFDAEFPEALHRIMVLWARKDRRVSPEPLAEWPVVEGFQNVSVDQAVLHSV